MSLLLNNYFTEQAGIDPERLTLALEPEAAALCCKNLELRKVKDGEKASLQSFQTGARFLVVDLGGKYKQQEVLKSNWCGGWDYFGVIFYKILHVYVVMVLLG